MTGKIFRTKDFLIKFTNRLNRKTKKIKLVIIVDYRVRSMSPNKPRPISIPGSLSL